MMCNLDLRLVSGLFQPEINYTSTKHLLPLLLPVRGSHQSVFCIYKSAYSRDFIEMDSHNTCSFVSGSLHLHHVSEVHPHRTMYHYFIPSHGWIIVHHMCRPQFVHPFFYRWTSVLFPPFGYCQ